MNKTIEFFDKIVHDTNVDGDNMLETEQFGDRKFRFGMYLVNQDAKVTKLRRGAIDELVIVDDLLDMFPHGSLVFNNPKDIIERSTTFKSKTGSEEVTPYRFRGDARDFLYIIIEPFIEDDGDKHTAIGVPMDSVVYSMRHLFCIHTIEDVPTSGVPDEKNTKLIFHDYRLQILRERNNYYSTAKNLTRLGETTDTGISIKQRSNRDRSKLTGEIIQDLLAAALMEQDTKDLFSSYWDFGSHELFYTSPANSKAIDDINYVLERHIASDKNNHEPCILRLERYTDRWEFLPLSEYFKRSKKGEGPGVYQSEGFLIASDVSESSQIPPTNKTFGLDKTHTLVNYHYPELSLVDDYTFSEIDGTDCQEMLNSVISHDYDPETKRFRVNLTPGNIENVHKDFQTFFIDNIYGGESGHGHIGWLFDDSRADNYNFRVVSNTSEDNVGGMIARNKTLLSAFLLGNTIQFELKGITSRRTGVWVSFNIDGDYTDTDYEKKVLGQYFVIRTEHRFTSTEYTNNIIGVKPYIYENLNFSQKDIFYNNPEEIKY